MNDEPKFVNGSTIDIIQAATHETVRKEARVTLNLKFRLSINSVLEDTPSKNEANVKKANI